MEKDPIVIKLSESRYAKAFSDNALIHLDEFNRAKEWIDKRIKEIAELTNEGKKRVEKIRLHDAITILGSRGSGKTTFLYSLLEYYKENEKRNVEVIETIDPTLIEEKGHVFLTILAQIAKVVNEQLSKSDCNPESAAFQKKREWERKLKNLAAGIPSIDGIGQGYENWQDPEFIMSKGLRSVCAAKSLESDFHELLKFGLEILGKKIFIIALDDIDIDFRKGWPVLEIIRKYLTSSYVVVLLSGDLRLFSKAIRKQQWENFGKSLLINEGEKLCRMNDYDDLVTEMEGQYLQKVMQPQRRIHLATIQEKINIKGKENIGIYINYNKPETNRIDKYYDCFLGKFGIRNQYQAEAYRSFLLNLPIRTQIQFLSSITKDDESTKEKKSDISSVDINNVSITDAFLSDLYEKRVDVDVAKTNTKYLDVVILKLLLQERALEEAYQLQPTTTDLSLNSSLTALSFLFSQKNTDNPYLIFDYFIRIGYIRNLSSILPYKKSNSSLLEPSIENLCKHSSIYYDRVYRDILGSMTAYIRAFLNIGKENRTSWGGTIPIYAPSESAKGKGELGMRVDSVFKDRPLCQKQIAFIPVSISQPNDKQASFTTYSIYILLASIGEVIKQHKENADLGKTLGELSQIRSYGMPTFEYHSVSEEDNKIGDSETVLEKSSKTAVDEYEYFIESIKRWIENYPKECVISPHVLGKISTRLFYALRNLENTESVDNLGDAMSNRIIILYNTILVEEAREFISGKVLDNNNPRDKIKVFKDNVQKVHSSDDFKNLKLFTWMFACPLLISFLDFDNKDVVEIIKQVDVTLLKSRSWKNVGIEEVREQVDATAESSWTKSIYSGLKEVKILLSAGRGDANSSQEDNPITGKGRETAVSHGNKINFYYADNTINMTIGHLKNNKDLISYQEFMSEDIGELILELKKIFTKNVKKEAIDAVRVFIINNSINPW